MPSVCLQCSVFDHVCVFSSDENKVIRIAKCDVFSGACESIWYLRAFRCESLYAVYKVTAASYLSANHQSATRLWHGTCHSLYCSLVACQHRTVCHSEYESLVRNCRHGNFVYTYSSYRSVYPRITDVLSVLRRFPTSNAIVERCFSICYKWKLTGEINLELSDSSACCE